MALERRGASPKVRKMNKKSFDVDAFLNTVDGGKSVANYQKNRKVFAQGDAADSVFYLQEGRVKISVVSALGKESGPRSPSEGRPSSVRDA